MLCFGKMFLPLSEGEKHKNWVVATQIFFIFIPNLGEDEPILTSIFFKWVGKNHQLENRKTFVHFWVCF